MTGNHANHPDKRRTTVTIYGDQYTVISDESRTHVNDVSDHVDAKMREMKRVNPYLDTRRLAVLTAINIADEYLKLEKQHGTIPEEED
ncbi:cell division protein ZapA [Natribacillus halophilus]|uniref:Cell division protein ZapA n=1 Tax=Natribacillus halophilus TaxID=549003 RepID=A0A1G8LUX7_9BACI|nr:cell division protein ZapA [Natribacillus halophilus]SDI59522.1 cell division protein ZapA [Natribacillus halophilus]